MVRIGEHCLQQKSFHSILPNHKTALQLRGANMLTFLVFLQRERSDKNHWKRVAKTQLLLRGANNFGVSAKGGGATKTIENEYQKQNVG